MRDKAKEALDFLKTEKGQACKEDLRTELVSAFAEVEKEKKYWHKRVSN